MNITFKSFLITGLLFLTQVVNASLETTSAYQQLTKGEKETFKYSSYFVFETQNKKTIHLTAFKEINSKFPQPSMPYDRAEHFGGWIRPIKGLCLNTRGVVLERDSKSDVSINQNCIVTSGDWYDPYTNNDYSDPADIQIDHVVALKNAYMTGAYTWTKKKRCLYANYLGNNFHLLLVNGSENMRKSDRSPSEYIPPNNNYICEYLRNWLEIKLIWQLRMTPREVKAIQNEISENHCTAQDMTVKATEIAEQRQHMENNKDLCQ